MFQAPLLQFLNSGVFRDLLQPLRAVHGADVYLQHFAGKYFLLLHEHSCSLCREYRSCEVSERAAAAMCSTGRASVLTLATPQVTPSFVVPTREKEKAPIS